MIEAHELTECYGDIHAVHSLSVTIAPGTVTGFPGPNGAGKPATMRMIMGLGRPTSGTVTVNGKPYQQHRAPLREVRALLEASAVHPGRSARSHLRSMAATHKIKASRVSEVIEMTGLAGVATKRVAGFSLGMGQRLDIAAASQATPGRSPSTSRSTGCRCGRARCQRCHRRCQCTRKGSASPPAKRRRSSRPSATRWPAPS
jgi:ABC-2 type transport system ATP-binding protein